MCLLSFTFASSPAGAAENDHNQPPAPRGKHANQQLTSANMSLSPCCLLSSPPCASIHTAIICLMTLATTNTTDWLSVPPSYSAGVFQTDYWICSMFLPALWIPDYYVLLAPSDCEGKWFILTIFNFFTSKERKIKYKWTNRATDYWIIGFSTCWTKPPVACLFKISSV